MTALTEYDRLEASALWRAEGETQKREVLVTIGDATLVISDFAGTPLAHWSLPAIERVNGTNEKKALYSPDPNTDERLEVDDSTLIDGIARIHRALERGRTHPGRLRGLVIGGAVAACVGLGIFWLPNALIRQAVSIVPDVTRNEIGAQLLDRMQRLSGQPCSTARGALALEHLNTRLRATEGGRLVVVQSGVPSTQHLPGRIVLLNRSLVEDFDDPAVPAGYALAEMERAQQDDPLERLLKQSGLMATLRLLTTGHIDAATLDAHTEALLISPPAAIVATDSLIERFVRAQVHIAPYAYAVDITGAQTLPLIEADAIHIDNTRATLSDGDWVALQGICGS
ncbi:hypothetical protein [Celeribacter marinus]|uniref:Uncharacterized protein n=1 Tax=Celeribacter marinus TaxID=1397108 RepID=A0A0P0ACX8_9RHOB|nr:hypothetical protein [Celeribacter marinus]ALI56735.1 hypothetical protein IMCC12053_2788 [Celeribacter marinus]SFK64322.1 hypothetical protein SAMN05444421_106174 [Celeribacter marinus]